ncbi:hypothetical protein SUGI_0634220 [Cryptomeria japonica]|nr:hypothetical protein SUGI_0634220 [Cryptomeria japonica]
MAVPRVLSLFRHLYSSPMVVSRVSRVSRVSPVFCHLSIRPWGFVSQSKRELSTQPKSHSMAVPKLEGGEGAHGEWRCRYKAALSRLREAFRNLRDILDKIQDSYNGLEVYDNEAALVREREALRTMRSYFDEHEGIVDTLEAVVTEQMKTSRGSSDYNDLSQRKMELLKQETRPGGSKVIFARAIGLRDQL